jgi:hypothetical protein
MSNCTVLNSPSWKNQKTRKGPRVLAKASSAETNLQQQQSEFYTTLTNNYKQQFANQSAILGSLTTAFQPILAAGINQYGFSPTEDASLRTSASDTIAQTQAGAQTALNNQLAARGGGNSVIPSGAEEQLRAGFLSSAATQQAQASNQITQAGYNQGRQNFLSAQGALSNAAGLYAPQGYAGEATSAGSSAFSMANTINQQNNAWKAELGGALGGIAGAFVGGPMGAELGSKLGGGGGSSEYDPNLSLATPAGFDTSGGGGGGGDIFGSLGI